MSTYFEPKTNVGAPFKVYLKKIIADLEPALAEELQRLEVQVTAISPVVSPLARAFTKANDGGKRVRSALVEFGYELVTNQRAPQMQQAAVAYEIMQTSILSHDDVVDRSELRRGMPTLPRMIGDDHRGISHGITLGDVGYFRAFRLLTELDFDSDTLLRGLSWFSRAMEHTGIGQIFDVELPYVEGKTEEDAITAYAWKTGWYTVTAPICMGATYAGASQELLDALVPFTQAAGIAFQIHDDVLGVYGDADLTKKSVSSDIVEGKHTVLSAKALSVLSDVEKEEFLSLYGNQNLDEQGVERVRCILAECGALKHAEDLALAYVQEAETVLDGIEGIDSDHKELLRSMAYYFIERTA